jgi:DNA-binding transcriptional LysR family regulator
MDWSDVEIFLAIAREGTLGAAARRLGLTQPTMGRRLKSFEAAMAQTLFQRTADGFILTDEGTSILGHAERMEEEALALRRALAGQDRQLDGLLRLSSSDWFGTHMLSPVLADFSLAHPKVTIELLTDARLLNLSRRDADLVFRITPFTEPDVISRKLLHVDYGLYIANGGERRWHRDGTGARLITMDEAFADMPDAVWLRRMLPKADVVLRSNSRDVQAKLCAAGGGLAVLPRPLGDATFGIERVDLGKPPPGRDTWFGYHRDLRRLTRLRVLLDLVVGRLAD